MEGVVTIVVELNGEGHLSAKTPTRTLENIKCGVPSSLAVLAEVKIQFSGVFSYKVSAGVTSA